MPETWDAIQRPAPTQSGTSMNISCDVLVVGSGAAGATLAATIAGATDLAVVLVEKGSYYGAEFFNQRELDMMVLLAQNGGRATAGAPYHEGTRITRRDQEVADFALAWALNPVRNAPEPAGSLRSPRKQALRSIV
jgi:choline dehydrogenase-like flavoprotein